MAEKQFIILEQRGVLTVAGEDRRSFLQGLISNDIAKVAADRAIYAALLTPQGKFLHDFFITEQGETLQLEAEAARLEDLRKRLSIYKLRSKVTIAIAGDLVVAAAIGDGALDALGLPAEPGAAKAWGGGVAYADPRLAAAGARLVLPRGTVADALTLAGFTPGLASDYDCLRAALGLPDGSRDLPVEKAILLENGFDELHGVDWKKGCYMGQELTARTKYRGLVRKRLMPVEIDGPAPDSGTPVMLGEAEAGEMRSSCGGVGLALLRLEHLEQAAAQGGVLTAGTAKLTPRQPDWMVLQKPS